MRSVDLVVPPFTGINSRWDCGTKAGQLGVPLIRLQSFIFFTLLHLTQEKKVIVRRVVAIVEGGLREIKVPDVPTVIYAEFSDCYLGHAQAHSFEFFTIAAGRD